MSNEEKEKALKSAGWHTYYNPDYWVNPKVVHNKAIQDYTNYGMSLDDAYAFETGGVRERLCLCLMWWGY